MAAHNEGRRSCVIRSLRHTSLGRHKSLDNWVSVLQADGPPVGQCARGDWEGGGSVAVHKAHGGNGSRNTDQSARLLVGRGWLQLLSSNLKANERGGEKVGKAGSGTRSGNAMNTCGERRASGNGKTFPVAEGEAIGRILWVRGLEGGGGEF